MNSMFILISTKSDLPFLQAFGPFQLLANKYGICC